MNKIVWTFPRFDFTLCNWILSASNAVIQRKKCVCAIYMCCLLSTIEHAGSMLSWEMSRSGLILRSRLDNLLSSAFQGWDHICLRSLFTRSFTIKYSESHMHTRTNTHTSSSYLMPNSNLPYESPDRSTQSRLNTCTQTFNHWKAARATYKSI